MKVFSNFAVTFIDVNYGKGTKRFNQEKCKLFSMV